MREFNELIALGEFLDAVDSTEREADRRECPGAHTSDLRSKLLSRHSATRRHARRFPDRTRSSRVE